MTTLDEELTAQPEALRALAAHLKSEGGSLTSALGSPPARVTLTGMGASYHAAWIGAACLRAGGVHATAIEAGDLLDAAPRLADDAGAYIVISQSGKSAEVVELAAILDRRRLIAITNAPASTLAMASGIVLPLCAGDETLIASKTYLNTLATLAWLAAVWGGASRPPGWLDRLADRVAGILEPGDALDPLVDIADLPSLLVCGHATGVATARQTAMMLAEWAKRLALPLSIGALRHGFIELAGPGLGAIVFGSDGWGFTSRAARDLARYGARVAVVEAGRLAQADGPASAPGDALEAAVRDAALMQRVAAALATRRGIAPGFRHLSKVVGER